MTATLESTEPGGRVLRGHFAGTRQEYTGHNTCALARECDLWREGGRS